MASVTSIRDVAKALNISITTVSRALDGYDDVSTETRQRVVATALQMGYTPNRAARQLRRRKADTVGFILPASAQRFEESYFSEFIASLGDALSAHNFDLLVANARDEEHERNLYQRWVGSHKVDGIVLNRIQAQDWRVQYLAGANFPFSGLGKSQDAIHYPLIRIDGAQGYVDLVQHLRQRGFARLAYIGGQANLVNHLNRLAWFHAALAACDLPTNERLVLPADMTSAGGYEATRQLLQQNHPPPDAILCINDETAFGALHAAHELGLQVGRDIAIAGFDGVLASQHTEPPLTTLDIPLSQIASQLGIMLLEKINGKAGQPEEQVIYPILRIRASTGDTHDMD